MILVLILIETYLCMHFEQFQLYIAYANFFINIYNIMLILICFLSIEKLIQLGVSVENAYVRVFHLSVQLFNGQSFFSFLEIVFFLLLPFFIFFVLFNKRHSIFWPIVCHSPAIVWNFCCTVGGFQTDIHRDRERERDKERRGK